MKKQNIRIGLFVGATFLILGFFIFIVGDLSTLFQRHGYALTSDFDTAGGLEKRGVVKMAGVAIGYVKDIQLRRLRARITMAIKADVRIPRDSKVTLSSLGLLGEKYVEIMPGKSETDCRPEDNLEALPSSGIEQIGSVLFSLGKKVDELGEELKKIVGKETKVDLETTLDNLSAITSGLKEWIGANGQAAGVAVRDASQSFRNFDRKVDDVSSSFGQALQTLKEIASENREAIKVDIEKISGLILKIEESLKLLNQSLEKIKSGQGTVGKLIQEPDLYDKARLALDDVQQTVRPFRTLQAAADIRADYYGKSRLWRARLGLSLRPGPDKSFSAEIIQDPWKDQFLFSAQAGRRWGAIAPRAGLIESQLGFGVDTYLLKDRLIWSLEGFDFNRGPRPRFRLASRFAPFPRVYVVVGIDDFALASKRELFFGLGWGIR